MSSARSNMTEVDIWKTDLDQDPWHDFWKDPTHSHSLQNKNNSKSDTPEPNEKWQFSMKHLQPDLRRRSSIEEMKMFRYNLVLLYMTGVVCPEGLPLLGRLIYGIFTLFMMVFLGAAVFVFTAGVFLSSKNVTQAVGAFTDSLMLTSTFFKMVIIQRNSELFKEIAHRLKYDFNMPDRRIQAQCRENMKFADKTSKVYTILYLLLLITMDIPYYNMFLVGERLHPLMPCDGVTITDDHCDSMVIPTWYPFDVTGSRWWIHGLTIMVGIIGSALFSIVFETLLFTTSQLYGAKLDNLALLLGTLERRRDPTVELNREDGEDRRQKLIHVVMIHQRLIRFIDKIEDAFQWLSFSQLMLSLFGICLQAFRLTAGNVPLMKAIPMMLYLNWLVTQLWVLCWSGENIAYKSTELSLVASRVDWQGADREFTMMLRFIMMRTQKPIIITAGKMLKLSASVFVKIMKNSYSAYTCIYEIHSKWAEKHHKV